MSLGFESERRLKDLLVAVGDGERGLEAARQRLCSIRDFASHSAFKDSAEIATVLSPLMKFLTS